MLVGKLMALRYIASKVFLVDTILAMTSAVVIKIFCCLFLDVDSALQAAQAAAMGACRKRKDQKYQK